MATNETMNKAGHEDVSRREVATLLFGALGIAALPGCAQSATSDTPEFVGSTTSALSGASFLWVDSISGSAPNLYGVIGSNLSATSQPVVVVGGYRAPGDGGGGIFYWDATMSTGDNGGTIIVPTGSITGRWKRVYSGPVNVKWFGAMGNDSNNDAPAINAAIGAAVADTPPGFTTKGGATVFFPVGFYRIVSSIEIIDDSAHGYERGVKLVGVSAGAASGGAINTWIRWDGDATSPMLKVWSRDCVIQHLTFGVKPGKTVYCAIDITQGNPNGVCTAVIIEHCRFSPEQQSGAIMTYGVVIGANNGVASNGFPYQCDDMRFAECYFDLTTSPSGGGAACVYIPNTTQQAKQHVYHGCVFVGAQYGLLYQSGAFSTYDCQFQYLTTCIKQIQKTDAMIIMDSQVEHCPQFFDHSVGGHGAFSVQIIGGRYDCSSNPPDPEKPWIDYYGGGPLRLTGLAVDEIYVPEFKIRAYTAYSGEACVMIVEGCIFPTNQPYYAPRTGWPSTWFQKKFARGNLGVASLGAVATPLDENLHGSATATGAATTAQWTFAITETDTAYSVAAIPVSMTGVPAIGSNRIVSVVKTSGGVTLNLEAAPGPSSSITFDILLIR